jgi:flavodoxin
MKIHMICFSQTGNTRKVAKAMGAVFSGAGHAVRSIPFRKASRDDLMDADLIGIGAPSFESQAPTPMREFLQDLSSMDGRKAFVFSTSGGAPGRVLYDLARPLQDRGADVVGGFLCRGTCFHPVPCLAGRFPERPDEKDLKAAEDFAAAVLEHLDSGRSGPMPGTRPDAHRHGFGFYQIIGAVLKDPLLRFLMPRPVADPQACNECRWCVLRMSHQQLAAGPAAGDRQHLCPLLSLPDRVSGKRTVGKMGSDQSSCVEPCTTRPLSAGSAISSRGKGVTDPGVMH